MSSLSRRPPLSVAPALPTHEPDLAPAHKEAVIEALRWAWRQLCQLDPELVRDGDEEAISERVEALLNGRQDGRRRAPGLHDFETVVRGASQRTADGRIQKKPDFTFRPIPYASVSNASQWGWFVECKIIDGAASVAAYRDHGMRRFCLGEYAAVMPSGAMLGYVRDRTGPGQALPSALRGHAGLKRFRAGPTPDRGESEHVRSGLPNPCVDLWLVHLWLGAPLTEPAQVQLAFMQTVP
jgi:hypothetical protein